MKEKMKKIVGVIVYGSIESGDWVIESCCGDDNCKNCNENKIEFYIKEEEIKE